MCKAYVITPYLEPSDLWDWLPSNNHRKRCRLSRPYTQILHVHLHHWRICKNAYYWLTLNTDLRAVTLEFWSLNTWIKQQGASSVCIFSLEKAMTSSDGRNTTNLETYIWTSYINTDNLAKHLIQCSFPDFPKRTQLIPPKVVITCVFIVLCSWHACLLIVFLWDVQWFLIYFLYCLSLTGTMCGSAEHVWNGCIEMF